MVCLLALSGEMMGGVSMGLESMSGSIPRRRLSTGGLFLCFSSGFIAWPVAFLSDSTYPQS